MLATKFLFKLSNQPRLNLLEQLQHRDGHINDDGLKQYDEHAIYKYELTNT